MPAADDGEDGRRLPRAWRLASSNEIRALFQRGKRSRTAHLDVFDSSSPLPTARRSSRTEAPAQLCAPQPLKRQLRESYVWKCCPTERAQVPSEILVRARREPYEAAFAICATELVTWVERRWQLDS